MEDEEPTPQREHEGEEVNEFVGLKGLAEHLEDFAAEGLEGHCDQHRDMAAVQSDLVSATVENRVMNLWHEENLMLSAVVLGLTRACARFARMLDHDVEAMNAEDGNK